MLYRLCRYEKSVQWDVRWDGRLLIWTCKFSWLHVSFPFSFCRLCVDPKWNYKLQFLPLTDIKGCAHSSHKRLCSIPSIANKPLYLETSCDTHVPLDMSKNQDSGFSLQWIKMRAWKRKNFFFVAWCNLHPRVIGCL